MIHLPSILVAQNLLLVERREESSGLVRRGAGREALSCLTPTAPDVGLGCASGWCLCAPFDIRLGWAVYMLFCIPQALCGIRILGFEDEGMIVVLIPIVISTPRQMSQGAPEVSDANRFRCRIRFFG